MTRQSWARAEGEITFEFGVATDSGPVRLHNEDAAIARPPAFLVADGMGGHSRGDKASATVARVFTECLEVDRPSTISDVSTTIRHADEAVRELRSADSSDHVGTTIAALVLVTIDDDSTNAGLRWMVAHLGDSRVYRHDATGLERLTVDHSVVQELIDEGALDRRDALRHPQRNVITRALGVNGPDAATLVLPASGRQCFLICSDGVCGVLDDLQLARLIDEHPDAESAATAIVRAALRAGGRDNATAVVVRAMVPAAEGAIDLESTDTRPTGVGV